MSATFRCGRVPGCTRRSDRHGLDVTVRDTDADLIPWLLEAKPDAAIITLHGSRGENGAIQGILEMAGVPYLGTRSHDCRLAYEKNIGQKSGAARGFYHARWMSLSHSTFRDLGAQPLIGLLVSHLGLPLMVKPQHGGSALGATAVRTAEDLPAALVTPSPTARSWWSSNSSTGVEIGHHRDRGARRHCAPCRQSRSCPTSGIFDYESRYTAGLTTYFTPARLSRRGAAAAADLAIGAHRASACGTFPGPTPSSPRTAWCISWRSTCPPG